MHKFFILSLALASMLTFAACSNIEGTSGIGRGAVSPACASVSAPWIGLDAMPASVEPELASSANDPILRAVTLNIHSGMGQWKGLWSSRENVQRRLDDMAEAIAGVTGTPVDIVALNEVDVSVRRSGNIDQARYLANALHRKTGARYRVVYGRTHLRAGGSYGNAVLVRHSIAHSKTCLYDDASACGIGEAPDMPALRAPGLLQRAVREGRGLIKLTLDFHHRPVDVIVTHLEAVAVQEREAQASHLLRRFVDPERTTVVLGDMNAVPTALTYARTFAAADRTHDILTSGALADARVLYDARLGRTDFQAWATFPSEEPEWPLDTALGSLDLFPLEARVMDAVDSDHRGFFVAYRLTSSDAIVAAQQAHHDTIRRRQLAQILQCDVVGAAQTAKLQWLRHGTQFPDIPGEDTSATRTAFRR